VEDCSIDGSVKKIIESEGEKLDEKLKTLAEDVKSFSKIKRSSHPPISFLTIGSPSRLRIEYLSASSFRYV
jgi:hypothetical protein